MESWASLLAQTFPAGSDSKETAYNAGDLGSLPRSGRSPGEGNGNPLNILAWKILWTEEPGGLQSMGSQTVRHNWGTNTLGERNASGWWWRSCDRWGRWSQKVPYSFPFQASGWMPLAKTASSSLCSSVKWEQTFDFSYLTNLFWCSSDIINIKGFYINKINFKFYVNKIQ